MVIEILKVDLNLFKSKPTEQFYLTELYKDMDAKRYDAKYILIDENNELHEKKASTFCTPRTERAFETDMADLYSYLIYLNSTHVYNYAMTEDRKLVSIKRRETFLKGLLVTAVCMSPIISYSLVNYNSNPEINTLVILLNVAYIIRNGMNIPIINELSRESKELTYNLEKMLIEEGERLVRKKR